MPHSAAAPGKNPGKNPGDGDGGTLGVAGSPSPEAVS